MKWDQTGETGYSRSPLVLCICYTLTGTDIEYQVLLDREHVDLLAARNRSGSSHLQHQTLIACSVSPPSEHSACSGFEPWY